MKLRLQKVLAQRGVASRREAEQWIRDGHISVNGFIITEMGYRVDPDEDTILVCGKELPESRSQRVLLLNKPVGYVCTCKLSRETGRSILELVPDDRRYFPVGRLDRESSGMIILTDNGDLALRLTHPKFHVAKLYEVESDRPLSKEAKNTLLRGVVLEDGQARAIRIRTIGSREYHVEIAEGRKRQIRRMFEAVHSQVARLHRIRIGSLNLGDLPSGSWRELDAQDIQKLFA